MITDLTTSFDENSSGGTWTGTVSELVKEDTIEDVDDLQKRSQYTIVFSLLSVDKDFTQMAKHFLAVFRIISGPGNFVSQLAPRCEKFGPCTHNFHPSNT